VTRHRVAILGAGTMGRRHARVLAASDRFDLVGVLDVDPEAARAVGDAWGVPRFVSELEAFAKAHAVVVSTPIGAHAAMVRRALAAGRHVLVEKPITGRAQDARALLDAAAQAGKMLFVGHSERFNPVVRALAKLTEPADILAIELRRIGSIRRAARSAGGAAAGGAAADAREAREHGALLNLGVHDLDLIAYLTRSSLTLRHALGRADGEGDGLEEMAHVLVRTGSGAAGHVYVDQRPHVRSRTIALTTKARLFHGDLLVPRLHCTCRLTGLREEIALDLAEPLALQASAFADALDGLPSQIATGFDGARALVAAERAMARMCDAALGAAPSVATVAAEKL
jgi:UDP-N-acetylglucosamine 3-dehydrogenase